MTVTADDGASRVVYHDEGIRPNSTVEVLGGLRPAYFDPTFADRFPQIGWHVTAGNSSQINDGSAALLIMSSERARAFGLTPKRGCIPSRSPPMIRS